MKTKVINYRGGVVRFIIPELWTEEYEEEGGATFYEPGDDTGTLRLSVLSFETDKDVKSDHPKSVFEKRKIENNAIVESLTDGKYLLKYIKLAEENGEALLMYYWEVARMISTRKTNIAVFNYTISELQATDEKIKSEVSYLDEFIKHVRFGVY